MNAPTPEALIEQLLVNVRQENIPAARAVQYIDQVLSTFRRIGLTGQDDAYVLRVLESIGESYEALGSLEKAFDVLMEALGLARSQAQKEREADLLWKIGRVLRKRNRWDEALTFIEESRQGYAPNTPGLAWCWINEGLIRASQGRYDDATQAYEYALEIGEQINVNRIVSAATLNLGIISSIQGDFDRALLQYQSSLSIYEQLDAQESIARTYHNIGICHIAQSNWAGALDAFEKSLAIAHEAGSMILTAVNYIEKAAVYLELKDTSIVATYCAQAIDICREVDYPLGIAEAYRVLGKMYTAKSDRVTAHSLLTESLTLCERYDDPLAQAETRREIGRLHISTNALEEARDILETARDQFTALGAQHDIEVTQNLIDGLGL